MEIIRFFVTFLLIVGVFLALAIGFYHVNVVKNCNIEYVDFSGQKQVINSSEDVYFRMGNRSVTIIDKVNDTQKTIYGDIIVECKN